MDSLVSTSVGIGKEIKVTEKSRFFIQFADNKFRVQCRDTIFKYEGLRSRCISEGDDIICIIPTSSTEMISLLALIFTSLIIDIDTLNFLDYLDPELPSTLLNMLSNQEVELSIPYVDYKQLMNKAQDLQDCYLGLIVHPKFSEDLLPFFKIPKELPIGTNLKYINHIVFSREYIPGILKYIDNRISPSSLTYILEYIRAYEIYSSITENIPPITYTDEIDILRNLDPVKYGVCWDHLTGDTLCESSGSCCVTRSYFDMVSIIKGRLKAHPSYRQIKNILQSGMGVITGGFIVSCMYNTDYSDIDICLKPDVNINEVKSMFTNITEENDYRFLVSELDIKSMFGDIVNDNQSAVPDLDIFVSPTNIVHNISKFHFSVSRAYYDGVKLYMSPSCLISAINNVVHVNPLRLSKGSIDKYLKRGFRFEPEWISNNKADSSSMKKIGDRSIPEMYNYYKRCQLTYI